MQQRDWFSFEVKEVVQELNSNLEVGLSTEEVNDRLGTYGHNTLKEAPPRSLFSMFIDQILEPLVLILLIAAIISGIVGEMADTILILVIVVLNATLGVFQENKAEQALQALKAMTKVYVKVIRDGKVTQAAAENLVPGDVVLLKRQ
jgi:Ca2+-transporting ATPase